MKKRFVIVNESGCFLTEIDGKIHFNNQFKKENVLQYATLNQAEVYIQVLLKSEKIHDFYSVKKIYIN